MGAKAVWISIASVTFGITALLICILVPLSFGVLNNDEVGLIYHGYTKLLEPGLQGEGRIYLGDPAAELLSFKRTFVALIFSDDVNTSAYANLAETSSGGTITCITYDGLSVDIQASLQYRIPSYDLEGNVATLASVNGKLDPRFSNYSETDSLLYVLVKEFGVDFEEYLIASVRRAIMNSCGQQLSTTFYYERGSVEQQFELNISQSVAELGLGITTSLFQLTNVNLPSSFSSAISAKEQARTDIPRAENERIQALIKSDTSVKNEQLKADLKNYTATQTALATVVRAYTAGNTTNITNVASASALGVFKTGLGFSSNDLLRYLAISTLGRSADLSVGVRSPANFGKANCTTC